MRTRFDSHLDLASLPWFEVDDDQELRLSVDLGYPVIDMHTHFAMTYFRKERPDTWPPRALRHYLPVEAALDLDVYANQNLTPALMKVVKRDLILGSLINGRDIRRGHTPTNLLGEMDRMGVGRSTILPIDFARMSYNAETYLEIARDQPRLIGFGSIHPRHRDPERELSRQKALGARGIKMHPAMQLFRPDSPPAMRIYPICGELDLPVFFHAGPVGIGMKIGNEFCHIKHLWPVIKQHPGTTFVLGHAGALQLELALELASGHDNCWLELASQSLSGVERILRDGPRDRILSGSDWPFYNQAMPIAKVMLATDDPSLRRAVLHDNAARLVDI